MKFPMKPPAGAEMNEMRTGMGVPAGKKMSVRNMARATPGARKKRPKPGMNPSGGYSY